MRFVVGLLVMVLAACGMAGCDVFFSAPGEVSTLDWEDMGYLSPGKAESPTVAALSNGLAYAVYKDLQDGSIRVLSNSGAGWYQLQLQPWMALSSYLPHLLYTYGPDFLRIAYVEGATREVFVASQMMTAAPNWDMGGTLGSAGPVTHLSFKTTPDGYNYNVMWYAQSPGATGGTNYMYQSGMTSGMSNAGYGPGAFTMTPDWFMYATIRNYGAGGALNLWQFSTGWDYDRGYYNNTPTRALDMVAVRSNPVAVYAEQTRNNRLWARAMAYDINTASWSHHDLCDDPGSPLPVGLEIAAAGDHDEIFVAYQDENMAVRVTRLRDRVWHDLGRLGSGEARDLHLHLGRDNSLYVSFCDDGDDGRARVFRLAR